jgi:serine/threonine protein kinase
MGEVYRAKDLKLGREVALKVLLKEFASDPDRLRRFEQEARAASALNHPNIVHIYDIGQEDDTHYIVMELVRGSNLRQLLVDAPFDNERLLDLSRQIVAGLANAHQAGIVHRDIKPENIMVTADGLVKILDFGLAKLLAIPFETHSEMTTLARFGTRHGMLIGTVEYMSPEQAAGKTVDQRSDQFSFGLILYEMATGTIAFSRETAAQTLASIIENEPRGILELNSRCPEDLTRVVRRCLEKKPGERYQDTSELLRELKSVSAAPPPPPPIPPVPQNPEPDVPSLGEGLAALVGNELNDAIGEVRREIASALNEVTFQIQTSGGKTKSVTEDRLRKRLRKNRYSGAELIRQKGEVEWIPLYQSAVFRQEVPYRGDPTDWARKRKLKEFFRHAACFVGMGITWFLWQGEIPMWMGFWGIGLAAHAINTVPAALPLWRRNRELAGTKANVMHEVQNELPDGLLSQSFRDEVDRVQELLKKRGGEDADSLAGEVDGIVDRITTLATKHRDLSEQTSPEEREELAKTVEEAERKLIAATTADDRRLFQRQFDVLRQRQRAIGKALVVIERLAVRQDVAEHQIRQLRLDLSRADASSASVPELTSRLQDIRHEVDATEKVDEAIAEELLS